MSFSSPVKRSGPVHAPHHRPDVQSFVVPDDSENLTLDAFWDELDYSPEDFEDYHLCDNWNPKEDFGNYMNEISKSIYENIDLGAYLLKPLVV
jgi:hypothetical protein